MAAFIYVAETWKSPGVSPAKRNVSLANDGYHWFLYRYFKGANLDRRNELVDLYGNGEINGYQLDRLEDEMQAALEDVSAKPNQWRVLTGWNASAARQNEIWHDVDKAAMIGLISQILWLITYARERHLKLVVSGD